ncbi:MAG: DUF4261 domain-containing protein [Candidatus Sigynarchaeota archaeon]
MNQTEEKTASSHRLRVSFALLKEKMVNWKEFERCAKSEYKLDMIGYMVERDIASFGLKSGDITSNFALAYIPTQVPNNEAQDNAQDNYFWPEAPEAVGKHQAHVIITIQNDEKAPYASILDAFANYAIVCSAVLSSQDAIGLYQWPTVYRPDMYKEFLDAALGEGSYPLMNLVYLFIYKNEAGTQLYTEGMKFFDKPEIEVRDSDVPPSQMLQVMMDLSGYVILDDVALNDGETIGFSTDQKFPISISKGIEIKGQTIKLKITAAEVAKCS